MEGFNFFFIISVNEVTSEGILLLFFKSLKSFFDIDTLKSEVTETSQTKLITFFLNDYCLRNSKLTKYLNKVKNMPTTVERNFLFK